MSSKSANHAKAPKAAAFTSAMRAQFGDVKVTHVSENGFLLGELAQVCDPMPLTIPYYGEKDQIVGYTQVGIWVREKK